MLPHAEVLRLGFHDITYRVAGRELAVPYALVQAGRVIALGDRGPLIVPKSVASTWGLAAMERNAPADHPGSTRR